MNPHAGDGATAGGKPLVIAAADVADLAIVGTKFRDDEPVTFTVRPVDCPPEAYLGLAMAQANARQRDDRREVRRPLYRCYATFAEAKKAAIAEASRTLNATRESVQRYAANIKKLRAQKTATVKK